jgi:hypothetical protein
MMVSTSSFYRVLADPNKKARWFLDEPCGQEGQVIDAREFTQGSPYHGPKPVLVPVGQLGNIVNFNFAAFDMPVVSERVAHIIHTYAMGNVQSFPVMIDNAKGRFEIINVLTRIQCLDEQLSETLKWKPEDGRPDKVGQFRMVTNLRIDPECCHSAHIFRVEGWEIALIVSCDLKAAIEDIDDLGVIFDPVSP